MKKFLFALVTLSLLSFLILLTLTIVVAENETTIIAETQNITGNISDIKSNIREDSNVFLEKNISFPQDGIVRLLFGIESSEPLNFSKMIVIVCLFLGLIIFLQDILEFIPFFGGAGAKSWIGSIIISLLIAISGVLNELVHTLFWFANIFNILERWRPLAVVFAILVVFAFFYCIEKLTKVLKRNMEVDKAENLGMTSGIEIAKLKARSRV